MVKKYIKPETLVFAIDFNKTLLSGSLVDPKDVEGNLGSGDEADPDSPDFSRSNNNGNNIWDNIW